MSWKQGYAPDRGDLVWLDFDPQVGREQAKRRPALVVSPAAHNRGGMALVCPVTSVTKGYPFEVPLPADGDVTGVVLADQLKSVDWRGRKAERAGRTGADTVNAVVERVLPLIDPTNEFTTGPADGQ